MKQATMLKIVKQHGNIKDMASLNELFAKLGVMSADFYAVGPATGARYENLLPWDDWRNQEHGCYVGLRKLYDAVGIYEGNGEWYRDYGISEKHKAIQEAIIDNIDAPMLWEWDLENFFLPRFSR